MGYNGFRPSNSVTYISVIRIKDPGCSEWLISGGKDRNESPSSRGTAKLVSIKEKRESDWY